MTLISFLAGLAIGGASGVVDVAVVVENEDEYVIELRYTLEYLDEWLSRDGK